MNKQIKNEIIQAFKEQMDIVKRTRKALEAHLLAIQDGKPEKEIQKRLHEYDAITRKGLENARKLDAFKLNNRRECLMAAMEMLAEKTKDLVQSIEKREAK